MKLKVPPITDISEGFSPDIDIFGRKSFGVKLTDLVSNTEDDLVIAIDANWGEGKTTFTKMWLSHLENEKFHNIYFDAFENDHLGDPFLAIAGHVYALVEKKNSTEANKFLSSAKKVGIIALKSGINIGLKAATGGILSGTVVEEYGVEDEITDDITKHAEKYIESKLKSTTDDKASISAFKSLLSNLSESLDSEKPIVFVIDELDRCKPDFALSVLEVIKHFFSVPNFVFVLVINRIQVEESIRKRYGVGIDASRYLQKFVTVWAQLPSSEVYDSNKQNIYITHCLEALGYEPNDLEKKRSVIDDLSQLATHNNASLREIEQILTNFGLLVNVIPNNTSVNVIDLAIVLAYIRVSNPQIFSRLEAGSIEYEELIKTTNLETLPDTGFVDIPEGNRIKWLLKVFLVDTEERNRLLAKGGFGLDSYFVPDLIQKICKSMSTFRNFH